MINLYLVDDDLVKVNYFEQILKIIDEHFKVYQCQNGFGANNRNAYLSFDLLDKAIQDKDGFWLLDISMPNSKHTGEKLLVSYVTCRK